MKRICQPENLNIRTTCISSTWQPGVDVIWSICSSSLKGVYCGEDVKYQGTGEGGVILVLPEIVIAEDRGEPS